jgi:hypothetical protein
MNGQKLTGLAAGSAASNDASTMSQVEAMISSASNISVPSKIGHSLQALRVNAAETGIEWAGVHDIGTTAQYLANTPTQKTLTNDQVNASGAFFGLTDGATIAWNMSSGFNASVTLGGNRTLANPTNTIVGRSGAIRVTQDGTGSRTLSFGTNWEAPNATLPTLSTAPGAVDYVYYHIFSSTSIIITGILKAVS